MSAAANPQVLLAKDIAQYNHDPLSFARYIFTWQMRQLEQAEGPRPWQVRVLEHIGTHLSSEATRYQPCQIAIASGHGIGKSALIAMVMNWAMSTCDDCKVVVTAGTGDQLRTKTVPEVSKWFRYALNADWWDVQAKSIRFKSSKRQASWRADFITWSEHNTDAFAGLHNQGKRILLVFDEASAIGDRVWEVAEGALTDEGTEIIWLAFGNPTQPTGRFRACFGQYSKFWKTFQIDSRTVEGTNKEQFKRWEEAYGVDSDFFKVRVRGEFPSAGTNQFISPVAVENCRKYKAEAFEGFPKIFGVDVARFGDDKTVIFMRQGRKSTCLGKYRGLDTAQVAAKVIEFIDREQPQAVIVDSDGIGAPVYDQLKFRGYGKLLFEFHGGQPAYDGKQYFNRRAEIWGLMREWINAGAEIPDDPELAMELSGPEYGFSPQQQIQLEKKDDMKERLPELGSPDCGDALAMTFAVKLLAKPAPLPKWTPPTGSDSWMY